MKPKKMSFQIIQSMAAVSRVLFMFLFMMLCITSYIFGQAPTTTPGVEVWLKVLPLITFLIAIGTGILNLYIMGKLGKQREEILKIVRAEFKLEVDEIRKDMATKENITALRESLSLQFENLKLQIQLGSNKS
jgi:hypothetical protein